MSFIDFEAVKADYPWSVGALKTAGGMGQRLIAKTGNMAAVQRDLGHKNASYSMQYERISDEELLDKFDRR